MRLSEVISAFEKEQTRVKEETVQQLKDEHEAEITELRQKLEVKISLICATISSNTKLFASAHVSAQCVVIVFDV